MMRFIYSLFAIAVLLSNSMCAQTKNEPLRYLALGDSYTIGESVTEKERWPVILAEALTQQGTSVGKPKIIAVTGWRTDNLINGINIAQLKDHYDLVSLLIGVNNQYQGKPVSEYEREYEDLIKTAIALAYGKKDRVFVVSIPDYGFTPFGKARQKEISTALDEFNAVNKKITEAYGISYFNITDISRLGLEDPELVASDGLHPSGKQYSLWVERIMKGLAVK